MRKNIEGAGAGEHYDDFCRIIKPLNDRQLDLFMRQIAEVASGLQKSVRDCAIHPPGTVGKLAQHHRKDDDPLSDREREVLVLVSHGYSRRDIAGALGISINTAARHISNIYSKLDVSSIAEATAYAFRRNLIKPT